MQSHRLNISVNFILDNINMWKEKFTGTVAEKSILNCTAGKFYLYKDSNNVSFVQVLVIQLLGKQ